MCGFFMGSGWADLKGKGLRVRTASGLEHGVGNLERAVDAPEFEFEGLTGVVLGQGGVAFARCAEQFPHPKSRQFAPFESVQTGKARTFYSEFEMGRGIGFKGAAEVVGFSQFEFEVVLGLCDGEAFQLGFPPFWPLNAAASPPILTEFEDASAPIVEHTASPAVGGAQIKRAPNFKTGAEAIQPESEQGRSLVDHRHTRSNRGMDPKRVERIAFLHGVCERRFHETKLIRP